MTDLADEAQHMIALTESLKVQAIRDGLAHKGSSVCEDCGEIINPLRRALLPSVTTCHTCQEVRELKSRTGTPYRCHENKN